MQSPVSTCYVQGGSNSKRNPGFHNRYASAETSNGLGSIVRMVKMVLDFKNGPVTR